jgi:hypothetical protein
VFAVGGVLFAFEGDIPNAYANMMLKVLVATAITAVFAGFAVFMTAPK